MILGVIYGKTRTSEYSFRVYDIKKIMQGQFVIAVDKDSGKQVLSQIAEIMIAGQTPIARCEVLGEIKDTSLAPPIRPLPVGSKVIMPPRAFLENLLVKSMPEKRLLMGKILTHPEFVPVYYNPDDLARHLFISATTGSGKSYTIGVIIEELIMLMERFSKEYSIIIFDVHNEYGGILLPNDDEKQVTKLRQFGLDPRAFRENVLIFDWEYNPPRLSPIFTPDRLMFIYGMKEQRHALILQRLVKEKKAVSLEELYSLVEVSDIHHSTRQALLTRIKDLMESGLFSDDYITPKHFVKPGFLTIFRLAGTPLGDFGIRFFVADILRQLYDKYRQREIAHKTILVIDEAHIFAPKVGKKDPVREIIERIAREGRKYGLWLILASQSPRDLSDVILMQCNSVLALRMHKEDVSEFSRIFGISKSIAETLTTFTPGKGYLKAPSLRFPVLVEIRPKCSFDIKGSPERQALVEKEVKKIAKSTRDLLYKEPTMTKRPIKLIEEKFEKPVPEERKIEVPVEGRKAELVEKTKPLLPKPKIKVKIPKKLRPKKKKKEEPLVKEVIRYDREVLNSVVEEIRELGFAARSLIKELIRLEEMSLSEALTHADERVIDALKVIGFIEERRGKLTLKLDEIIERRIGRKLSTIEKHDYLEAIYDQI